MAEWKNLVSMFYSQADRMGEKPFIWSKVDGSYKSLSWKEAAYQITTLSSSLKNQEYRVETEYFCVPKVGRSG